jgi:hypothetical protein
MDWIERQNPRHFEAIRQAAELIHYPAGGSFGANRRKKKSKKSKKRK